MKNKQPDSVTKNIFYYSSSAVYRRVLGLLNAYIKPKLLTPELFGLWNLLSLIAEYGTYSDLGSRIAMRYLLPFHEGRNDRQAIGTIRGTAYRGSLYLRLILVAILIAVTLLGNFDLKTRWGLFAISLVVLISWYHSYYVNILKAYHQFRLISIANYMQASITVFVGLILLYYFNIYGAYATAVLSYLIPCLYFRIGYPMTIEPVFSKQTFISLVKKGFPILAFNFILLLIGSSDRIIVASFLGTRELGFYAIAGMIFNTLMQVPGAAREVVEPHLMQTMGEQRDSDEKIITEYLYKPLMNTACLMPLITGVGFFLLPVVITALLPRYIAGILPAQLITLGSYFIALVYTTRGIIIAADRQLQASGLMLIAVPVNVLLSLIFLKMGLGLAGVALGSVLSFIVLFILLALFLKRGVPIELPGWNKIIMAVLQPFFIMIAILLLLFFCIPLLISNIWLATLFNLSVYVTCSLTLMQMMQKKHPNLISFSPAWFWQKLTKGPRRKKL